MKTLKENMVILVFKESNKAKLFKLSHIILICSFKTIMKQNIRSLKFCNSEIKTIATAVQTLTKNL